MQITQEDISKIENWDYNEVFELMRFVYSKWEGRKETTAFEYTKDGDLIMDLQIKADNENNLCILQALRKNEPLWNVFWFSSDREGKIIFKLNICDIGFMTTLDYCTTAKLSRNAPYRSPHLYYWYVYSEKIKFVKRKNIKKKHEGKKVIFNNI